MINVKVENTKEVHIDMYAAIILGGKLYWYPVWDINPHSTEIEPGTYDEKIVEIPVSDLIPAGYYTFFAAVTEHETINIFEIDSVTIKIN